MKTLKRFRYDPTGVSPDNTVQDEPHVLPMDLPNRVIVPQHFPVYTASVVITDVASGETLKPEDYLSLHFNVNHQLVTAKEVSSAIVIKNPKYGPDVTISYQCVGGEDLSEPFHVYSEILKVFKEKNVEIVWNEIRNKPDKFKPIPHYHHISAFTNLESLLFALNHLADAIKDGDLCTVKGIIKATRKYFTIFRDFKYRMENNFVNTHGDKAVLEKYFNDPTSEPRKELNRIQLDYINKINALKIGYVKGSHRINRSNAITDQEIKNILNELLNRLKQNNTITLSEADFRIGLTRYLRNPNNALFSFIKTYFSLERYLRIIGDVNDPFITVYRSFIQEVLDQLERTLLTKINRFFNYPGDERIKQLIQERLDVVGCPTDGGFDNRKRTEFNAFIEKYNTLILKIQVELTNLINKNIELMDRNHKRYVEVLEELLAKTPNCWCRKKKDLDKVINDTTMKRIFEYSRGYTLMDSTITIHGFNLGALKSTGLYDDGWHHNWHNEPQEYGGVKFSRSYLNQEGIKPVTHGMVVIFDFWHDDMATMLKDQTVAWIKVKTPSGKIEKHYIEYAKVNRFYTRRNQEEVRTLMPTHIPHIPYQGRWLDNWEWHWSTTNIHQVKRRQILPSVHSLHYQPATKTYRSTRGGRWDLRCDDKILSPIWQYANINIQPDESKKVPRGPASWSVVNSYSLDSTRTLEWTYAGNGIRFENLGHFAFVRNRPIDRQHESHLMYPNIMNFYFSGLSGYPSDAYGGDHYADTDEHKNLVNPTENVWVEMEFIDVHGRHIGPINILLRWFEVLHHKARWSYPVFCVDDISSDNLGA